MQPKMSIGLYGEFTEIQVLGQDGCIKRGIKGPKNLVTDIGLARIRGQTNSPYMYCRAGTGNAPPAPLDINLQNQIGSADHSQSSMTTGVNMEEGYIWTIKTWTFSLGAVVGNVSELATGWQASGNNSIYSRALIRDENGNPTSITVLEDEQLRVSWEHRWYFSLTPVTGVIANSGNKGGSYEWAIAPARLNEWVLGGAQIREFPPYGTSASDWTYGLSGVTGWGNATGGLAGGVAASPAGSASTVNGPTPNSIILRFSFSVSQGNNTAGLNGFHFRLRGFSGANTMFFKAIIDPPILKTSEDFLEIDFQLEWHRYEPA